MAGADGVIIGDQEKYMKTMIRMWDLNQLISECDWADIILVEGMKHGTHPKFEIVRKGISETNCSDGESLIGVLSGFKPELSKNVPVYDLADLTEIVRQIEQLIRKNQTEQNCEKEQENR